MNHSRVQIEWQPIALTVLLLAGTLVRAQADDQIDFGQDILPILSDTCFTCHGPDPSSRQADLRLDIRDGVFADLGGYAAVVPGEPQQSELFLRLTHPDRDERMPPRDATRQLNSHQIELIQRWIEQGASWGKHWSFVRPERPQLPAVNNRTWARNPIDRFVLARLQGEGLEPSRQARRETLIRRVTLDLTGLPPTPDEINAFLADESPHAYEMLVDRLLKSQRYGEHMAIAWLDAARYADTDGYQNDRIRYHWVWRDWVIRTLNENMPFDQFTLEQLAGDMLPDATLEQQIATAFNRNHRINSEGGSIPSEWHAEYVADRVDTLATVWLGLTMQCARCHDHKYDPISQREFYQLFAAFNNVAEWGLGPNNGNSPPFIPIPKNWPHLTPEQNRAITPAPYEIKVTQTSVPRPQPGGPETLMVMHELDQPRKTYLLQRGQYNNPDQSEELFPGVPKVLGELPEDLPRNRLGLAQWLVDPANPLTARVTVNRFWQSYFGTGLVKTSENFGIQGDRPSHPQLLDWLAIEFIRLNWDMKAMHRLMVTSATYRQSSAAAPDLMEHDPDNRLLARGPRVRLGAHATRDLVLAVSGLLVQRLGGPSVRPYMPKNIWRSISGSKYKQDQGASLYRRSLYTYWRRTIPPPTMMAFNAAERDVCLVRKDKTITPQQALALMNNITFVEGSRMLAQRMIHEGGAHSAQRLAYGFRLATSDQPAQDTLSMLQESLEKFLDRFQDRPQAAKKLLQVGEMPRDEELDHVELAAYTMAANLILNLDQTVTKD